MQKSSSFWRFQLNAARIRIPLIIVLIGILPMTLIGSWLIILQGRSLREQTDRELTVSAQNFADRMDIFVATLLNNAQASAALPDINSQDPEQQEKLLQLLNAHYPDYGQMALVNLEGQIEIVAKPQELVTVNHIPSFQDVIQNQTQSWVIAPALFSNDLLLHMHTPIFDESGNMVMVLGTPVPLDNLTAVLANVESGTAFVLDEDGQVLLHPNPHKTEVQDNYGQWIFTEENQPPQQAGVTSYMEEEHRYIASYAPIPRLGWTVVVERPASAVLQPIMRATNQLIIGMIATVLGGLTLAIFVSGRMTQPMRELILAARDFGEGKADYPLPQSKWIINEINVLINTFAHMRTAVTERETTLQQSESRVRALIDAMPDTLLRVDANFKILDAKIPANSPLEKIASNPIGLNLHNYLQHVGDDTFCQQIEQALEDTQQKEQSQLVEAVLTLPGQKFDIETRIMLHNNPQEALLILRDITEQKEAEASIHKLVSALEAASEGLAILDQSQTFVYANNAYAKINGYQSPEDIIGQKYTRIYDSAQHRDLLENIVSKAKANTVWRGEVLVTRPDNSTYLQELSLNPLASGDFVCVIRDITEQRKSEEAIREAQKLDNLGLLAGGVAHDFNNLLTGILGHATLALEKADSQHPVREQLQKVVASASKAADLTRQLLAYAGKGMFEVQPIDINQLIRENLSLLETALPNKTEILLNLEPGIKAIEADSGQIQQVLMNLLINAAESFKSFGGQIQIQTRECHITPESLAEENLQLIGGTLLKAGEYACLVVKDNGSGIDHDTLNRIFDPFFSTKDTGTGLGLSATLGIIRAHKGGIRVKTEIGQGTTFTVYFKTSRQAVISIVQKKARRKMLSGTALVIDDQETILAVAEDMLKARGMEVLLATSGLEGLAIFEKHQQEIDVVLLDLKMPGMGGDEVYIQLKEIDPEVRVIIASGYSEQETLNYFVSNNKVAFIQKPYRFQALVDILASVLGQTS